MRTENIAATGPLTKEEQGIAVKQLRGEFHICDERAANWYLRKQANLEAEKARVMAQCAAIIKQLDSDAEGLRYLYEAELQEYVRECLAAGKNRRKSLTLLQGTCAFRSVAAGMKISDEAAALDYARQSLPDALRVVETLDTGKYRQAAECAAQDGTTLPGCELVPQREAFRVTFGKQE